MQFSDKRTGATMWHFDYQVSFFLYFFFVFYTEAGGRESNGGCSFRPLDQTNSLLHVCSLSPKCPKPKHKKIYIMKILILKWNQFLEFLLSSHSLNEEFFSNYVNATNKLRITGTPYWNINCVWKERKKRKGQYVWHYVEEELIHPIKIWYRIFYSSCLKIVLGMDASHKIFYANVFT